MDFRSLQLFNHLATSLHFGETADAMYVSPSTLSRVIQRLEEECGCVLFRRDNRKVALTHSGHKLYAQSREWLKQWQALQHELREQEAKLQGELSLYCSVTASQKYLPDLLRRFRSQYPGVDIRLTTGDPAVAVDNVKQGVSEIAVAIHTPDLPTDIFFQPMDTMPIVLIAPKELGLTQLAQVNWTQHPVVMPEAGPGRRIVYHWFAEQGIRPHVYASVAGNEAIVSMVALGCGLGFVPQVVLDYSTMAQQVNRIQVPGIEPHQLGLCCLQEKRTDPLVAALLQCALS